MEIHQVTILEMKELSDTPFIFLTDIYLPIKTSIHLKKNNQHFTYSLLMYHEIYMNLPCYSLMLLFNIMKQVLLCPPLCYAGFAPELLCTVISRSCFSIVIGASSEKWTNTLNWYLNFLSLLPYTLTYYSKLFLQKFHRN